MIEAPAEQTTKPEGFRDLVFIDPTTIKIEESTFAGLEITIEGEKYEGVRASLALPITDPEHYVSLRVGATKGEEIEIGMIRNLSELSEECQKLIRRELKKRYFLHVIHKIIEVKEKFGFIYFDTETNKGMRKFAMRYEYNRVQDYGEFGRVILDTDDNRYIIPDLRLLLPDEYKAFTRYVYW